MKIAITGSGGLLGWHTAAHLHAINCAAAYSGQTEPHEMVLIDHQTFADKKSLVCALHWVQAIVHYAGVNRGPDDEVERANPAIAQQLIDACQTADIEPSIVYANSTHASTNTHYGRSKRLAGELLEQYTDKYTNLVLPHIFGESAKPYYNNVTATLIDKILKGERPEINPNGKAKLLHAGDAADLALNAVFNGTTGTINPPSHEITIQDLYEKLKYFHELYKSDIFPSTSNPLDLKLFNTYRSAGYPNTYPKAMKINSDARGVLYESAKGGDCSQTFLSITLPGITRGDHFHIGKVERFLVVKGKAIIRLRKVLTEETIEFEVTGENPVAIDMIPLHTHSIENVGDDDLYTFFWTHEMFNPDAPDTYADPVLKQTK